MNQQKIISFDLGTNSIGAIIRNPLEENQFEHASVITFETGVDKDSTSGKYTVSLAANRTAKRSIRRLYQSRKYKLWAVLKSLIADQNKLYCPIHENSLKQWMHYDKNEAINGNGGRHYPIEDTAFANWIKLDFNGDGIPDYLSPYQLRDELATQKLNFDLQENRFKLGRALYHIAQHRGFKSSKLVKTKDDEKNKNEELTSEQLTEQLIGAEKKKQTNFLNQIKKLNIVIEETDTIGSIFARIETECIHNDNRKTEGIRIRKELHQYVTRKMLIKEVEHIFSFQELNFGDIFKEKNNQPQKIHNSWIFWQRPLRSQKGLVGICTFENQFIKQKDQKGNITYKQVGKKRCPVSRPEFEEFRALSFINNIKYCQKVGDNFKRWQSLPNEIRKAIYEEFFFVQSDFAFSKFYKCKTLSEWLTKECGKDNWELNYNPKTNVSACSISKRLKSILGEDWNKLVVKKDKNGVAISMPLYEELWHVLFESNDEDFIEEYAYLKGLDTKQVVNLWYAMQSSYAQLSLKAINNILPFLRQGFKYTDAVLLAKVPKLLGERLWKENEKFITESFYKEVIDKNRKEKHILAIVNNLIAQYKTRKQEQRFADHTTDYIIGSRDHTLPKNSNERDDVQILNACINSFDNKIWTAFNEEYQSEIINRVSTLYQDFFRRSNHKREFYKMPRLGDAMKQFLVDHFKELFYCPNNFKPMDDIGTKCNCEKCKKLHKLYHPSAISFYPPAKEEYYKYGDIEKRMIMLGSPKTGSWKNPMALRTLHELKKLVNYYIATNQIDEETRVVVEVGRELVDTNKRYAYETYKRIRQKENEAFAAVIRELAGRDNIPANADSASDIDKFRLWYEMLESEEGLEENKKFTSIEENKIWNEREVKKTKNGKKKNDTITEEPEVEKYYSFGENHFEKIKKQIWFKLKSAKDNITDKYRLWKEQEYRCIYTGKMIKVTDLYEPNLIDIEHTLPLSQSFDDSLANKTVCFADFNRNIKKNQLPALLSNYDDIKKRIEKWEQKVKDLEVRVEFWKAKSKQASTKDYKDSCIRERHLWQFELDYWKRKVEGFTIREIKAGFKNSQLKDMQLISKYAQHYLKTYFHQVDVQKGEVTAHFRKIFKLQPGNTEKDRSKHSHHAKDAVVLSLIPNAALREKILETWFKLIEEKELLEAESNKDKASIELEIKKLENELADLVTQCRLPKGVNDMMDKLDAELLINNKARNRSLLPASKNFKVKGKLVKATGDAIRGQLHKDSFYGAIKLVKKDENGKWVKNESENFEFEPIKYVIRKELVYKKNSQSPGFKDLEDLKKQIIDKHVFNIIESQVNNTYGGDFKEALNQGIWMLDSNGNRVNKIRRIRIELEAKDPVTIKKHIHLNLNPSKILPNRMHKQYYYAGNGENIAYGLYQNNLNQRGFVLRNLFDISTFNLKPKDSLENLFEREIITKRPKAEVSLFHVLTPGLRVIFFKNDITELSSIIDSKEQLSKRTYLIEGFEKDGRVKFRFHLDSRSDQELKELEPIYGKGIYQGFSEVNYENPWPKLKLSKDNLNMAIEGKHFEIMPDGVIVWKFDRLGNIKPA
jgi:CRISPR-associated endonuclease Csn1